MNRTVGYTAPKMKSHSYLDLWIYLLSHCWLKVSLIIVQLGFLKPPQLVSFGSERLICSSGLRGPNGLGLNRCMSAVEIDDVLIFCVDVQEIFVGISSQCSKKWAC